MNIFLIEKYISKIKKEDIYNYALKENIHLTEPELNTLYYYLITYHQQFLTNPSTRIPLLNELKQQVSTPVANKLQELYNQYQYKI